MVKRTVLAAICVCGLALAAPAGAQQGATVVLRSGERIGGDLIDYGAGGFSMRVNGQTRDFPARDVASVELSGRQLTPEQQAKLNAGQPFVLLNDGQVVDGRIFDIGGSSPLRITIDTPSGQRDFNSSDVAGIYIAGTSGTVAVATSGVQPAPAGALIVPGTQQWTPTNITVRAGETLRFNSSGEVRFTTDVNDRAGIAGSLAQKRVGNAPMPAAFAGALIGRIDNGQPFAIGDQSAVRMPASGMLYLGVNDDNVGDNSGQFQVVVSR